MNLFKKAINFAPFRNFFLLSFFVGFFQIVSSPLAFAVDPQNNGETLAGIEKRLIAIEENQEKIIEGQANILAGIKQVKIWIRRN